MRQPALRWQLCLLCLFSITSSALAAFQFPGEQTHFSSIRHHTDSEPLGDGKSTSITLKGGLLHTSGFYFDATVGDQPLTLQVDISYSSLIVPKKGCEGCRVGDNRYDPTKSDFAKVISCGDDHCEAQTDQCKSEGCFNCNTQGHCCVEGTDHCAFNMFYKDGSSGNGTMYLDQLKIGDLKAKVLLGAMHEESHNFELPYADGVLGLAFQKGACHPACIPPVYDSIVNQTGLGNVFSMCVSRFGGTLVLGAADESLGTGAYHYVSMDETANDNRFIVPAQSEWKVADRTISVPGVTNAMWTAGTSDIGMSKSTFLALLSHFTQHYCHIDGLCSMTSWFRPQLCGYIPDQIVQQMPNITMGLVQGVSITLTPDDYLIKYRVIDGKQARCVAFIAVDGLAARGIGLLLGTTVMRRYAVAFDKTKKRVGLSPANPDKCGPTSGTDEGLPGGHGEHGPLLTADAPKSPDAGSGNDTNIGKKLLDAERCRAADNCFGCSRLQNCSYGYKTGKCIPSKEAGKTPYPFCEGVFCACFATGQAGWYFGVGVGVLLAAAIAGIAGLIFRKAFRRNRYQMVQQYEEQDLETF